LAPGTHELDCENTDLAMHARFSATIRPEETTSMLNLSLEGPPPEADSAWTRGWRRSEAARRAFHGSRILSVCWQQLLRLVPEAPSRTVGVRVSVDAQGRFTGSSVENSPDPRYDACIRDRLGLLGTIGEGVPVDLGLTVNLVN